MNVAYLHNAFDINLWVQQHVLNKNIGIIGLDIEWKPVFSKHARQSRTSVLQIAAKDEVLVISLLNMSTSDIPSTLKHVLESPSIQKIGVGIKDDADKMRQHWNTKVENAIDLASIISNCFPDAGCRSLKDITAFLIDYTMEKNKKITLSNWEKFPLSQSQLHYAAIDAWVAMECAQYFINNMKRAPSSRPGSAGSSSTQSSEAENTDTDLNSLDLANLLGHKVYF